MDATISNGNIPMPDDAFKKMERALISHAPSAIEADKIVRKFNSALDGEDTVQRLIDKYEYICDLFGVDKNTRAACDPSGASDFAMAATDYYSLLSVLTLKKLI